MPENPNSMTREELLFEMNETVGLHAGAFGGDKKLEELQNWDSTALISLTALTEATRLSD